MLSVGGILAIVLTGAVFIGSCRPDTETTVCEETGLRCPSGFSCSFDQERCISDGCGDLIVSIGEACDDGNTDNTDGCLDTCELAKCGDSYEQVEVEQCDDGNRITEKCAYGEKLCMVCDDMCFEVHGVTSVCGDRIVQSPDEMCDDGNGDACGTCDAGCKTFVLGYATGGITVIAPSLINDIDGPVPDRDDFTLNDGINPPVTFEFDRNNVFGSNSRKISIVGLTTTTQVRDAVRDVINSADSEHPLLISATTDVDSTTVTLRHMLLTSLGNQVIVHTVTHGDFQVGDMKNGGGADCKYGIKCRFDADCLSNICLMNDRICGCQSDNDCSPKHCNKSIGQCE
ncbi:MAG TPA: DUF4215 domain-containing protein [Kofleriaceae bacterium]|nr:DUF4215 domain-containing protein [Kofleriaceae bacterium]